MSTEREIPYVDVAGHAVTLRAMAANLRNGKPGDPECWAVLFDKYAGVVDRLRAQVAAADELAAACDPPLADGRRVCYCRVCGESWAGGFKPRHTPSCKLMAFRAASRAP